MIADSFHIRRAEEILPLEPDLLKRRPGPPTAGTNVTVSLFLVHIQVEAKIFIQLAKKCIKNH